MIKELLLNEKSGTINEILNEVALKKNVSIFGTNFGEKTWLVNELPNQCVYITTSLDSSNKLKEQFECFGKNVDVLLFKESDFNISDVKNSDNKISIIKAMYNLVCNKTDVLIISPELLMQRLPDVKIFKNLIVNFKENENYNFSDLIEKFAKMGYKKANLVEKVGDFSVKGDIIDIFPVNNSSPIRLQFFDTQLEKIKVIDLETLLTTKTISKIDICPNSLIFINDESNIISQIDKLVGVYSKTLDADKFANLQRLCEEVKFDILNQNYNPVFNWIIPFLNYSSSIIDYTKQNSVVAFDDTKQIVDYASLQYNEFDALYKIALENCEIFKLHEKLYFSKQELFEFNRTKISFQHITTSNRIFVPDAVFTIKTASLTNYYGKYDLLKEELGFYREGQNKVVIFTRNKDSLLYLEKFLRENRVTCQVINNLSEAKYGLANICSKPIKYGAVFPEEKLVLIGSVELQGKKEMPVLTSKRKKDVFTLPKLNDYVVHETYGIGLCLGIERLKLADRENDYIIIQYDKGDKIYLPTEQVGMISAYVNTTNKTQKLSRIGTNEFLKVKERVKKSIKEMAFDLLALYAQREKMQGFVFQKDDDLSVAFDNDFPFTETEDQILAIKDIKQDMESGKIMDRLICGDVGYGKTEVAMRAIFKAVMSGKQVCFLAPTTILSQQHYNTCMSRMSKYLVNVQVLNRFKTKAQQTNIINALKNGDVNVICGTHRLLSNDVVFKDLGLLVLDEEQRFGVQDKEKIKNIRKNIDVLTLSATPIPRTLHLSMTGIRDISLITTPPEGRLPVQTTVTEYSENLLKEAITREIVRGGQVLVVYNSIEHIYSLATKIRNLVGDCTIDVAHGQMAERELEKSIMKLYNGETQVLVSTTLIENGIDLPNANTLFVIDADRMGLSQLYQLKGRVGRSRTLGYAYFTYQKEKVLTEEAYKRLNALMEFTELGSGFKIALRDLEIRGCGNIIGKEQHGHMEKVGYDMYCKLLNEALAELRGKELQKFKDIKLDIAIRSFIPTDYILEDETRLAVYNNLIDITSESDRVAFLKKLEDIYGKLPEELDNLSKISLIRYCAQQLNIKRITITQNNSNIEFYDFDSMLKDNVQNGLKNSKQNFVLNYAVSPMVKFDFGGIKTSKKVDIICNTLSQIMLEK